MLELSSRWKVVQFIERWICWVVPSVLFSGVYWLGPQSGCVNVRALRPGDIMREQFLDIGMCGSWCCGLISHNCPTARKSLWAFICFLFILASVSSHSPSRPYSLPQLPDFLIHLLTCLLFQSPEAPYPLTHLLPLSSFPQSVLKLLISTDFLLRFLSTYLCTHYLYSETCCLCLPVSQGFHIVL